MLKKHWWKALAAVLLFYSLSAGLLIPLRMGIVSDKSSLSLKTGQSQSLDVWVYNGRFESGEEVQARILLAEDQVYCAQKIEIGQARQLKLEVALPQLDPNKIKAPFPLIEISTPKYGTAFTDLYIQKGEGDLAVEACQSEPFAMTAGTNFPFLNILEESIRNLFYHVPMWFGMMFILLLSVVASIKQLMAGQGLKNDHWARALATVGVSYGLLGLVTGAIWAKHTWGAYWSWDVKQNTSAVAVLIYLAYFVLRSSFEDPDKRARIAATYNIFAFATLIPLLYVVPRMVDSLHPGAEGNPAFSSYDLDSSLRLLFYPSVLGWIIFGLWLAQICFRVYRLEPKVWENQFRD